MSKFIQKYLELIYKSSYIEYLKHNDIASMLRAFLGAVYNCFGTSAASKIMKKFNLISDEWICALESDDLKLKSDSYNNYTKMVERFKTLKFPDIDIKLSHKLIEEKMKYTFHEPNILAVALTHKSKAKHKNGSIWDDYNLMEFLGDSVIKFFNCKRIISNRKEFVKNKEKNFTDIQRLKFIRTASEKNILFRTLQIYRDSNLLELLLRKTFCLAWSVWNQEFISTFVTKQRTKI